MNFGMRAPINENTSGALTPEIYLGAANLEFATDLWGAVAILYFMIFH